MSSRKDSTNIICDLTLEGEIRRGIMWSKRFIFIKNNILTYKKSPNASKGKRFRIDNYDITQNVNLEDNEYKFYFFEKLSYSLYLLILFTNLKMNEFIQ